MHFHFQAIRIEHHAVAEVVVDVPVRGQKMHGLQALGTYIILDGRVLGFEERTAVDDDALTGLVADNIAVLLQHVAHKTFDIQHSQPIGI